MSDKIRKIGRTGFLIVLLEIIIESIVGAVWTVIEAVTQCIRLRLCKRRSTPKGERRTSGTATWSGDNPVCFGVVHPELVHQQFGSSEE